MKASLVLAAVATALLSSGLALAAAPPGVTPEMIATALPEEGAPKAVAGKYAVTQEPGFNAAGLKTFRPTDLSAFPKRDTLPVVVWGNGGCALDNPKYDGFLSTIASHGFLVIATAAGEIPPNTRVPQATANDLKFGIDWAERENGREGSPLRGKIDTGHVAVMGQSCGGMMSIQLGADPRVDTIGVFNAGVSEENLGDLQMLHGPVLLINGHERDFMMARSKATFDAIGTLPAFYGSRHGAGHTATAYHVGGGEFANVATNWVRWQFKGDRKASEMFVGAKCSLCTNSNWDVAAKNLKR